jgi:Uma2 family endonuclease
MAIFKQKLHTIGDFKALIALPENAGRLFELIHGEMVEVSPGRTNNSALEHILSFAVRLFCQEHDIPCYISGGDGAFEVNGHVVAPDFAYKHTPMSDEYPDPAAPEWAIEIVSPTDRALDVRDKRNIYIEAGILYGELYPQSQSMDIDAPGQPRRTITIDDGVLDGGHVLPGFAISLKDIFSKL